MYQLLLEARLLVEALLSPMKALLFWVKTLFTTTNSGKSLVIVSKRLVVSGKNLVVSGERLGYFRWKILLFPVTALLFSLNRTCHDPR